MESITIRRMHESDDLKDLIVLSRAFFSEYEAHHAEFFELDHVDERNVRAYFSSFVGDSDRAAFIALEGHQLVAYITVYVQAQPPIWRIKRIGHISGLMVAREHRRRGIAGELLNEAKGFFGEHGVDLFTVYTAVENQAGVEFYLANEMEPLYAHFLGRVVPEG